MITQQCGYLGAVAVRSRVRVLLLSPTPPPDGCEEGPRPVGPMGYLAPGTSVDEVYLPGAPKYYDNENGRSAIAKATPLVLDRVRWAESEGYDVVVVNCTLDPGVPEAQAQAGIPVLGIGATSLVVASLLGQKPAKVFPEGIKVLELASDAERTYEGLAKHGRWLIAKRGVDVLIPDCAYIGSLAGRLQEDLGVPVLPNLAVGLKMAELLASLNVRPEQPWVSGQRASRLEQALSRVAARVRYWLPGLK